MDHMEFRKATVAAARVPGSAFGRRGVGSGTRLLVRAGLDLPVLGRAVNIVVRFYLVFSERLHSGIKLF